MKAQVNQLEAMSQTLESSGFTRHQSDAVIKSVAQAMETFAVTPAVLDSRIDKVLELFRRQNADIKAMQGDIASLQGDVSALRGNVSALRGNVSALQGNVSAFQGNVSALQAGQEEMRGDIRGLQDGQKQLCAEQKIMRRDLDSLREGQDEMRADIKALDKSMIALQKSVQRQISFYGLLMIGTAIGLGVAVLTS